MAYDPGKPTKARYLRHGVYSMDSFKGENTTYLIDINNLTCTCGHYRERLAGTGGLCKHLKELLLQETDSNIIEKARQCEDGSLDQLLERYRLLDRPDICNAIRLVRQERRTIQTPEQQMTDAQLKELFR